jgi:hypothetical protein
VVVLIRLRRVVERDANFLTRRKHDRRSAGFGWLQDDHRDDAPGLFLVFGELRDVLGLRAEEALTFIAGRHAGNDIDRVGLHLDRDVGL